MIADAVVGRRAVSLIDNAGAILAAELSSEDFLLIAAAANLILTTILSLIDDDFAASCNIGAQGEIFENDFGLGICFFHFFPPLAGFAVTVTFTVSASLATPSSS